MRLPAETLHSPKSVTEIGFNALDVRFMDKDHLKKRQVDRMGSTVPTRGLSKALDSISLDVRLRLARLYLYSLRH
jgi:hypothetical protein